MATHHASLRHAVLPTHHASPRCFLNIFHASSLFRVTCHIFSNAYKFLFIRLKCSPLNTRFSTNKPAQPPSSPLGGHIPPSYLRSTSTLPPGDHVTYLGGKLLSFLSVKLIIHPPPPPSPLVVFQGERGEGRLEKEDRRRETGRQGGRETGRQGDRATGRL